MNKFSSSFLLQYNTKRVIIKSRLRDNQKTKRKEETKMTMTKKPKSIKLQKRERVLDIVNIVSELAIDNRGALYDYADKLSDKSKRRVCILAKLSGEIQVLEKYIDDIGVEIVYERAQKILDEANLIATRLIEEVDSIEK